MTMQRVSREATCPVCGRPDWCLVASDKSAAICSRVQSSLPRTKAGWLHVLTDGQRPAWREVRRPKQKPKVDFTELAKRYWTACDRVRAAWLSRNLGVSVAALNKLRVGWNSSNRAYSFPMRESNGNVCGLRYRSRNGDKFSELHSSEGLFLCRGDLLSDYLIIVEGASDTAAMLDLGFPSVVGRANCRGNIEQIESLCRRQNPERVIIIPDSDIVGIAGARQLARRLELQCKVQMLVLPSGMKDVRACCQEIKNAAWLSGQVGKLIESSSSQKDKCNDNNV